MNKTKLILISLIMAYIVIVISNGVIAIKSNANSVNIADLPVILYDKSTDIKLLSYTKVSHDIFEITRACYDKGYAELCVSDLWAIGRQESYNKVNTVAINSNRTADLGYFGINTIHNVPLQTLSSVYLSANWVIQKLEAHGYNEDRLDSIGKYHSKTPTIKARYINNISRFLTIK